MTRYVLTVNLMDDPLAIETYRRHHERVWPEVLQSLRDVGVKRMDIHLLGRQLVMFLELADGLDFRRVFAEHAASSPRVAEWERLMKSLQEPSSLAPAGQWWTVMEPVFRLDDEELASARVVERSVTS
jgi:L-rhamnose mutarotase